MSFSIQTNVSSLIAQENLRVNNEFQSRTIARLTSGYRITASGDDAAGLAVANKYRSDIAELVQGVRNANDGISTLQIVDGGLNNVAKILDRLKTLATQSASSTFTGNRTTLNNEYQALLTEITRQANNIGLVSGGTNNVNITVYGGGGSTQANSQVSMDLSGSSNRVDSSSLGINSTSVAAGGSTLTGNSVTTLSSTTSHLAAGSQTFTFRVYNSSLSTHGNVTVTVTGGTNGVSGTNAVTQLNSSLAQYGVTAAINTSNALTFGGTAAFSVSVSAVTGGGNALATATATANNQGVYSYTSGAFSSVSASTTNGEIVTFQNASGSANVTFTSSHTTQDLAISVINAQTASLGIYAVVDADGTGFSVQSASDYSIVKTQLADTGNVFTTGTGAKTVADPDTTSLTTANALASLTALATAVTNLGVVQGKVGTGQNKLQYAITLAQSQISSFSAAESRIRDADMAAEAANLTKAQVLQQASLAAMAQANAAPQAVLALLRG